MKTVTIKKSDMQSFWDHMQGFGTVYAPVKRGEDSYAFEVTDDVSRVEFDYTRTILPPKKFFYPPEFPMFSFSGEGYIPAPPRIEDRIILFGVHPCDVHGLNILDVVFSKKYRDEYYFMHRKRIAIIALGCMPDEHCFCASIGTSTVQEGFDLAFTDIGGDFFVTVGTSLGDDITRLAPHLFSDAKEKDIQKYLERRKKRDEAFTNKVDISDLPYILEIEYGSGIWDELGEECLSCGSCSVVCPTCYCYDVLDRLNLDGKTGERIRMWDSCLFKEHAMVAGGENFREERSSRIKHRFIHKHQAFAGDFGRTSCVGCGRCITACPAGIDISEIIREIKKGLAIKRNRKS